MTFKVGDRVRYHGKSVCNTKALIGLTGIVEKIDCDCAKINWDDKSQSWKEVLQINLELAPKFKVGDRVRGVGKSWPEATGKLGTVKGYEGNRYVVEMDAPFRGHDCSGSNVAVAKTSGYYLEDDSLELATDQEFKAGDFVRATANTAGSDGSYVRGGVYEVSRLVSKTVYTVIDSKGNERNGWGIEWFKPATFAVGDKVIYTGPSSFDLGIGKIENIDTRDTGRAYARVVWNPSKDHPSSDRPYITTEEFDNIKFAPAFVMPEPVKSVSKFKAGDRVKCISNAGDSGFTVGNVYTVSHIGVLDMRPIVYCRNEDKCYNGGQFEERWQLYVEPVAVKQPCIVAAVVNGQPAPSTRPYVHASQVAAIAEASRLALANPGKEFAVYERVTARIADKPEVRAVA